MKMLLHVFCGCSRYWNSNSECSAMHFHGSKMKFHEILEIQDFSKMMPLLDAHVLQNARGSGANFIALRRRVFILKWCEALLSVVVH